MKHRGRGHEHRAMRRAKHEAALRFGQGYLAAAAHGALMTGENVLSAMLMESAQAIHATLAEETMQSWSLAPSAVSDD